MSEDERLIQYVQLQTLSKGNQILAASLVEVLAEMNRHNREWFLQRLVATIREHLQIDGEDVSAHAGLLGGMMRQLIDAFHETES